MVMLTKEKIEIYRKKLEEEKKKLLQGINKDESTEDFGNDVDMDEETDEAENFSNSLAIAETLKMRVNEIDSALNKIEIGSYGVCKNCNGEISEKMLDLVPESQLCEACKKSQM
jgi:DnaK suppressor protein